MHQSMIAHLLTLTLKRSYQTVKLLTGDIDYKPTQRKAQNKAHGVLC